MNWPRNRVSATVYICDSCNQKVTVLWRDNHQWYLCPTCWPIYHNPNRFRLSLIEDYKNTMV